MDRRTRDRLLYHTLRTILWVGSRLPLSLTRFVCSWLTRGALRLMKRDRLRMRENIAIAFPEFDEKQTGQLMRGCADHLGRVLAEVAWLWGASAEDVEEFIEIEGLEHITEGLAGGRGGILVTGHIGNWEFFNAAMSAAGVPYMLAVRELDDPRMNEIVTGLRTRFGAKVVQRGQSAGRQLANNLRSGDGVGLLIDQDIPKIPGVFVPFFGSLARTPSGAATLALRMRCPMVPGFIHRKPDGTHKIVVHPPIDVPTEGTLKERIEKMTADANAAIEWQIRSWPEQWVWMHRRWRTRPEDEAATRE